MNRGKFSSNAKRKPIPMRLRIGGRALISRDMLRSILDSINSGDREYRITWRRTIKNRYVTLIEYHAPTEQYLVSFEADKKDEWINAEDLEPTNE